MISPPGLSIQGDKYKDAIAALWEHAEPDAQRLLMMRSPLPNNSARASKNTSVSQANTVRSYPRRSGYKLKPRRSRSSSKKLWTNSQLYQGRLKLLSKKLKRPTPKSKTRSMRRDSRGLQESPVCSRRLGSRCRLTRQEL